VKTTHSTEIEATRRFLDELFADAPLRQVGFRLWDGAAWPDPAPRAATVVLRHPGALRAMFAAGTEKALGEAYLRDDFDVEGDLEAAFEIAEALAVGPGWKRSLALAYHLHRLPENGARNGSAAFAADLPQHSLGRDAAAIGFHYDVSNDFYQLWLDSRMVYSCAYFEEPGADLETAQAAKLEHLCRKLRLRPGQEVLDIGCGWGGFALYAAGHHGVRVTGVTLSEAQAQLAGARVRAAGRERDVRILRQDYRELGPEPQFDAIVSVGMAEHLGRGHLAEYFRTAGRMLRPGGTFLNHAIGEGHAYQASAGPSFIDAYVFPDSDLPPLPLVTQAAADAGFEIRDVENLREHYALTLRQWVRRLEAAHAPALAFVDEPTYRVWRVYMAGSARGFARGRLAIYQTLLAKPDAAGAAHLPLTRRDWYR
jgi:cyclopropane-fatty-acyl-phospholipid synthase